jgi:hypothetical protein
MMVLQNQAKERRQQLDSLRPYVRRVTTVRFSSGRLMSCCVRASFAKAFEFVDAATTDKPSGLVPFMIPSLRGIVEDLIVLRFVSRMEASANAC